MAKMTPHQLKLVSTEWKWTHKVYQEAGEVVEEWHTVALYVKGKDAVIYDPPSTGSPIWADSEGFLCFWAVSSHVFT
jgi:hypothetical protein